MTYDGQPSNVITVKSVCMPEKTLSKLNMEFSHLRSLTLNSRSMYLKYLPLLCLDTYNIQ